MDAHAIYSEDSPDYILWLERRLKEAEAELVMATEARKDAMALVYECREEVAEIEHEIMKWKRKRYGKSGKAKSDADRQ